VHQSDLFCSLARSQPLEPGVVMILGDPLCIDNATIRKVAESSSYVPPVKMW